MQKRIFFLFICLFICSQIIFGFSAKVVKVSDGDTIIVQDDSQKKTKVRLFGIDAPEKDQKFGLEAKQFVIAAVLEKQVEVEKKDIDRYSRTVALVYCDKNVCLNEELIKNGFAWVYRNYYDGKDFIDEENLAKINKKGLWSDPNPMPPWDFRKNKRNRFSKL